MSCSDEDIVTLEFDTYFVNATMDVNSTSEWFHSSNSIVVLPLTKIPFNERTILYSFLQK